MLKYFPTQKFVALLQRNHFEDDDNINYPNFLIFVDHEEEAVVLAIRGTKDFKDVLTDLVPDSTFAALLLHSKLDIFTNCERVKFVTKPSI